MGLILESERCVFTRFLSLPRKLSFLIYINSGISSFVGDSVYVCLPSVHLIPLIH
jgi:hypothetical protein